MALGSTQPLTEMSTRCISWGKGGRCVKLTTLPPSCAVVMKSGNLNFLEPSGPLQACNGTALTFYWNLEARRDGLWGSASDWYGYRVQLRSNDIKRKTRSFYSINFWNFTCQFDDLRVSPTIDTRTICINVHPFTVNNCQHTLHNNPEELKPHTATEA